MSQRRVPPNPSPLLGLLPLLLVACGGETNFSKSTEEGSNEQGVGEMSVSTTVMVFTDVLWDPKTPVSSGQTFLITNIGDNNLAISTLDIADSGGGVFFTEEQDDLIIAPEGEKEITVVATLTAFEPGYGELRIKSNDGNNRDLRLPLCAFPKDYVGDMACGEDENSDTAE